MYNRFRLPLDSQWPPVRSESFVPISLRVVKNDFHHCSLELCDIFEGKDKHERINTVLIEGAPGIGKTATSLTICKEWTSGKHFQFFDMLIFWSLKDPALQNLCSLDELFFHDSGEVSQSVAQRVKIESGKGVLFILDGWDELPSSVSRARNHCLFDIIRGKRLPFASVVVTTRSVESQHLLQKTMFDRRIDICGFSSVSIQKYIHRCFLDTPERAIKLVNAISERPDIESVCHVPINCAIISYVYAKLRKLPTTFTQFYSYLTLNGLLRNIQLRGSDDDTQITQLQALKELPPPVQKLYMALCELAFRGLIVGMHSFSRDKIAKVCQSSQAIIKNVDNLGILQAVNVFHVTGMDSSFHFLHSTVQEFMAARYLASLSQKDQKYYVNHYLDYMPFETVWQFYCGISAEEKTLFDSEIIHAFQGRVREIACEDLLNTGDMLDSQFHRTTNEEELPHGKPPLPSSLSLSQPSTTSDRPPSTTLSLCAAPSSSGDIVSSTGSSEHSTFDRPPSTTLSLCPAPSSSGDVVGSIGPQDLGPLSGISLTLTGVTSELAFVAPPHKIDTKRLLVILRCIYESQDTSICRRIATSCGNKLAFHFSLNAVDTNAIGYLIGKGSQKWKVSFVGCGLEEKEIRTLKHQVLQPGKPGKFQELVISDNPLSLKALQQLCEMCPCLRNLRLLSLASTQLSDDSMKQLSPLLRCSSSLSTLDLSDNAIFNDGMQVLSTYLMKCPHLSELKLSNNHLTEVSMTHLASVIEAGCQLSWLGLGGNAVENAGIEILLSCLPVDYSLTTLDLCDNHITFEGAALMASALSAPLCKLETLVLSCNPIGTEGAHLIFSAINCSCSIQRLSLCECDIAYNVELGDAIRQSSRQGSNLQQLQIDNNSLGDEGIAALCEVIQSECSKIVYLSIASNDITPSALMELGPMLNNSKLEFLSLTASELSLDTENFEIFLQFMQWSENLRYLDVCEVGSEKEHLEIAFENVNSIRREQGSGKIVVEYHLDE